MKSMLSGECTQKANCSKANTNQSCRYWKWQHDPEDETQTYQYHLKTYGENVTYDDFAANFTGSSFNAKDWVDLFADAGAQYFVPTTSTSLHMQ